MPMVDSACRICGKAHSHSRDEWTCPGCGADNGLGPLQNKFEALIVVHTTDDDCGRSVFTVHWWDEGFRCGPQRRSQVYRTRLTEIVRKFTETGREVRIDREGVNR